MSGMLAVAGALGPYAAPTRALLEGRITALEHAKLCCEIAVKLRLTDRMAAWDKRIAELEQAGAPQGNALAGVAR